MERTSTEAMSEVLAETNRRQRKVRVRDSEVRVVLLFKRKGMI